MKKVFALCFAAGLLSLVACGPSAEEQAKKEEELRHQMDSLFNKAAQDMNSSMSDSTATTPAADTTATPH
jgi:hypothetical protein